MLPPNMLSDSDGEKVMKVVPKLSRKCVHIHVIDIATHTCKHNNFIKKKQ